MSLEYILRRVESKSGLSAENTAQRTRILDVINEAARELYQSKDLPISLKECYVRATADKELALPPFVGELRAVRRVNTDGNEFFNDRWSLVDIRQRYNSAQWPNMWKNWRLKGTSAVCMEIDNAAPGNIIYEEIDAELTVTISGQTLESRRIDEAVVMTTAEKAWTKSFLAFHSIKKSKITDYDLALEDADGNEIAVIYADQLESRYQIVDVSQYPDLSCCEDGSYAMEILYKPRLPLLYNDSDTFPVDGYDDVIVLKTIQLLLEEEDGKEQKAILAHQKANRLVSQLEEHKSGTIDKKIQFGRNKKLGLFRRRLFNY